jgi:hypothetical protein
MHEALEDLPSHSRRHSRHALKAIKSASTHLQKQLLMDDYLYLKVHAARKPAENAEVLRHKLEKLVPCLSPVDAEQLSARCAYYVEHIAGLTKQKQLITQSNSLAAKAARQAEQAEELADAVGLVAKHMHKDLQPGQGPQARLRVLAEARNDIEAALAFPKREGWDDRLDALIHRKASEAPVYGPNHSTPVAKKLNACTQHEVEFLADHYFYQKIVVTWSVSANQGHTEDELQALLPQLVTNSTRQCVLSRAQFYIRHMSELCDVKLARQQSQWADRSDSSSDSRKSKDQWRLVMHSADSQHFATVLDC